VFQLQRRYPTAADTKYIGELETSSGTTYPFVSLEPIPPEPNPKWITGTLRTIDDQLTLCLTDVLATSGAFCRGR